MSGITIVEASAGSGKTYELAGHFMRLLVSEDHPRVREILAVTFTNKASFEMKDRVLGFLKKTALELFEQESEKKRLVCGIDCPAKDLSARALKAVDAILENYSHFRIQTIDSLVNSMLETSPLCLNLPARFDVKTNSEGDIEYALDELINSSEEDRKARKSLLHFIDCYLTVENKTGWFPRKNMLETIFFLLSLLNNYGRSINESPSVQIWKKRKELFQTVQLLKGSLPEGTKKSVCNMLEKIDSVWDVRTDKIITKAAAEPELPVKKGFAAPPEAAGLWNKFRKNLRELCEAEAYTRFNPYIEIFNLVFEKFRKESAERRMVFLQELNRLAAPVFKDELMEANELYLRLACRFKHYMLDEFQDTSMLQWINLSPLIEEALSTGGTLFCVGDRKQAIYRFRGGDFTLARKIKDRYAAYGVSNRQLSNNFRSHRQLVLFNNGVFSRRNLQRFLSSLEEETMTAENYENILDVFSNAEQSWQPENDSGYITAEFTGGGPPDDKDGFMREKLARLAGEIGARIGYENTAVLARDNKAAEKASSWLIAAGIPVQSDRTLDARENIIVKEIISLLKFLMSPVDNISFAAFIQGRIFTEACSGAKEEIRRIIHLWAMEENQHPLYVYFRKTLPEAWSGWLENFFKTAGMVPLYEFALEIIQKFRVLKNFPGSQAFIMKFLEIIKTSEAETEDVSIHSFFEYLETAPDEAFHLENVRDNSVKVMTIHKAKGLEFDAVILPFFEIAVKPGSRLGSAIVDLSSEHINLLKITRGYTLISPELARIYGEEYARAVIDELNTAYVALTRAKRELYIFMPEKSGNGKNKARLLIPEEAARGEKTRGGSAKPGIKENILSASAYHRSPGFLNDEFSSHEPERRRELLSGEAVHYILSRVQSPDEAVLAELAAEAGRKGLPLLEAPETVQKLRKLFTEPSFRKVFTPAEGECAYREKEIVDAAGFTRRIDRLVVSENSFRVIDFKMSENRDADFAQVKEYLSAVKKIFPGRRGEGFVVYITSGKTVKINHE